MFFVARISCICCAHLLLISLIFRFVLPSAWWHSKGAKRPMPASAVRSLLACGGGTLCTNAGSLSETIRAALAHDDAAKNHHGATAVSSLKRRKGAAASECRVVVLFESDLVTTLSHVHLNKSSLFVRALNHFDVYFYNRFQLFRWWDKSGLQAPNAKNNWCPHERRSELAGFTLNM